MRLANGRRTLALGTILFAVLAGRGPAWAAPPNDQCSGAISIPCGNISLSGNTFTATNDYDFPDTTLSCTGYSAGGRDVVYKLDAIAGDSLWVHYQITGADASIYLVTNCANPTTSCVAGADINRQSEAEDLRYHFNTTGTYYLVLDSYGADTYGAWTLVGQFLSCGLHPPANDRCDTATPLNCGAAFGFSGSTALATNDYAFASLGASCTNSLAQGRDVAFSMSVTAGDSITVSYTTSADGVLYIMPDCPASGAAFNCTVGANATGAGGAETINYRFQYSGTYYLVLDSDGANTSGNWTLSGAIICGLVTPANDQCATATLLPCGAFNLSGDNTHAVPDYDPGPTGCTGFNAQGPDVVYRITAAPGESLYVNYGFPPASGGNDVDASIYLVTDCSNVATSCVAGADNGASGVFEHLEYKFPARGTYYLVLDTYDPLDVGHWTATGAILCPNIAGVGGRPAAEMAFAAPAPNPFRATSTLRFTMPASARAVVRIHDLAGRVVRTVLEADLAAGDHAATWDGRDDAGRSVPGGTYFARLQVGGRTASRTLVFMR